MTLPTSKELERLAKTCRKAGIKHFKCGEIEFTLADQLPEKPRRKSEAASPASDPTLDTGELPYEALLHWSVSPMEQPKEGVES